MQIQMMTMICSIDSLDEILDSVQDLCQAHVVY